MVRIIRIWF